MKHFINIKAFLILLVGFSYAQFTFGQEDLTSFTNQEISVKIKEKEDWSYQFGLHHRNTFYENEDYDFSGNFLEVNHYTHKKIGENGKLSGGFRYRSQLLFDKETHQEMRLIEQYSYNKKLTKGKLSFRVRLAQRFKERITFRSRYRIAYKLPLRNEDTNKKPINYVVSTEVVWEFGKNELPSLGQRFATGFSFGVFNNGTFTLTGEYRHRNYTQNPYTEVHINTGLSISL